MFRFKMRSEQIPAVKYKFHEQTPTVMDERDVFHNDRGEKLAF